MFLVGWYVLGWYVLGLSVFGLNTGQSGKLSTTNPDQSRILLYFA
jgi:hypothetical protein